MRPVLTGFSARAVRGNRLVPLLYVVGGLLLYGPILGTTFLADDYAYLDALRTRSGPAVLFEPLAGRYFRPAVVFIYWLNYQLAGLRAWPYHLSVLGLHVWASWLVYRLGLRLWPRADSAAPVLAGLLFLTFAGHSEAVTWIGGMADPLVTCLVLSALLLVLRYLERPRPLALAGSWAAFAGALLAKESALVYIPLAGLMALFAGAPGAERPAPRRLVRALGVPVLLTAALVAARLAVLGFATVDLSGLATNHDPVTVTRAFALRTILPLGEPLLALFRYRLDVLVLAPLVAAGWVLARPPARRTLLVLAAAWLCALAPVLPLTISLHTTESERLIYMATAFSVLLIAGWTEAVTVRARTLGTMALLVLAGYHAVALQRSNANWREAARITQGVLASFGEVVRREGRPGRRIFVVNVPDDVRGAYIFRRGFHDALRITAPDQIGAMAYTGVLSVYQITDPQQRTSVRATGARELQADAGGPLLGVPNPPTDLLRFDAWAGQGFTAVFTPAADGSLVLYLTPDRTEVFGRIPFPPPTEPAPRADAAPERIAVVASGEHPR